MNGVAYYYNGHYFARYAERFMAQFNDGKPITTAEWYELIRETKGNLFAESVLESAMDRIALAFGNVLQSLYDTYKFPPQRELIKRAAESVGLSLPSDAGGTTAENPFVIGTQQRAEQEKERTIEHTKRVIQTALKRGFLSYFEEFYKIVSQTAKNKGNHMGKRAAAQMLYAAYDAKDPNGNYYVDRETINTFTAWLDVWSPITGISNSKDYKPTKLENGYFAHIDKFSNGLRVILYPY